MTGVEVILAALAAGAGAGATNVASTAVLDAYTGLRDALRRVLAGRHEAQRVLDAQQTEPGVWHALLGEDLVQAGADRDEQVLAAAQRLLALADPGGAAAGKYAVDLSGSDQPQVGDNSVRITTSYGPTAGTMTGPVSVSYGQVPPVPPAPPEA